MRPKPGGGGPRGRPGAPGLLRMQLPAGQRPSEVRRRRRRRRGLRHAAVRARLRRERGAPEGLQDAQGYAQGRLQGMGAEDLFNTLFKV